MINLRQLSKNITINNDVQLIFAGVEDGMMHIASPFWHISMRTTGLGKQATNKLNKYFEGCPFDNGVVYIAWNNSQGYDMHHKIKTVSDLQQTMQDRLKKSIVPLEKTGLSMDSEDYRGRYKQYAILYNAKAKDYVYIDREFLDMVKYRDNSVEIQGGGRFDPIQINGYSEKGGNIHVMILPVRIDNTNEFLISL